MILDQLESNMLADLGRDNANSVMNEIKSLGIKFPKARKNFALTVNRYLEVSRQAKAGEIMRPEAIKIIKSVILPAASDYIDWAVNGDPEEAPGYVGPSKFSKGSEDDALNPEGEDLSKHKAVLDKFEATKASLQKRLAADGKVLAYAPVLPLCKPYLLDDKLSEHGIKASKLAHYTILERQLVLGIDNDVLKSKVSAYSDVKEALGSLAKLGKLAAKASKSSGAYNAACVALRTEALTVIAHSKSDKALQAIGLELKRLKPARDIEDAHKVYELARKVCAALGEVLKAHDGPVTELSLLASLVRTAAKTLGKKDLKPFGGAIRHLDATWVWLLTDKEVNTLQACALGKHFSLTRWGFGFANE